MSEPAESASNESVAMAKPLNVFLSYSRQDVEFARKLAADLKAEGHLDPWLDVTDLNAGDRWENKIREAIGSAEVLLVLLSSSSVKSEWVMREAELATSQGKGRVIPVIIDEGAKSAVPGFLNEIQWLDLSTPARYASGLRELSNLAGSAGRTKNERDRVQGIRSKKSARDRYYHHRATRPSDGRHN
jgi:hypothetical protein